MARNGHVIRLRAWKFMTRAATLAPAPLICIQRYICLSVCLSRGAQSGFYFRGTYGPGTEEFLKELRQEMHFPLYLIGLS